MDLCIYTTGHASQMITNPSLKNISLFVGIFLLMEGIFLYVGAVLLLFSSYGGGAFPLFSPFFCSYVAGGGGVGLVPPYENLCGAHDTSH